MELVELGGELLCVAAPTRSPQATAGPCLPRPGILGALLQLGGRADGRSDGAVGVGRTKSGFSLRDQGSGGLWVLPGCPSKCGAGLVRGGVLVDLRKDEAGWAKPHSSGSRLAKGGV